MQPVNWGIWGRPAVSATAWFRGWGGGHLLGDWLGEPPPPQLWTLTLRTPPDNVEGLFFSLLVYLALCSEQTCGLSIDFHIFCRGGSWRLGGVMWAGPSSKGPGVPEAFPSPPPPTVPSDRAVWIESQWEQALL